MINKNIRGAMILSIVIGSFIMAIVILGMVKIISFNIESTDGYLALTKQNISKNNSNNILKKINTNNIEQGTTFYLYKNDATKTFDILTGAVNEGYKYIDVLGNKIDDPASYNKQIFTRVFNVNTEVVQYTTAPDQLEGTVSSMDTQDIDADGLADTYSDGDPIETWSSSTDSAFNAFQTGASNRPTYVEDGINGLPSISFNGVDEYFNINNSDELNLSTDGYDSKSFFMVFQTSDDVSGLQTIYEQGDQTGGYSIIIHNGSIHGSIWNDSWPGGHSHKTANLGVALTNTVYYLTLVQDADNNISVHNKIYIYLNGVLSDFDAHVNSQEAHTGKVGMGATVEGSKDDTETDMNTPLPSGVGYFFKGYIGEFAFYNELLDENEVEALNNYAINKWESGPSGDGGLSRIPVINVISKDIEIYNN